MAGSSPVAESIAGKGTGKTTTIQAVATFLQRDIYYVDLQKAKLNEDLQMIFEYVNKHVPNSGIVSSKILMQ